MKFPARTFTDSNDVCDWIADLPIEMRWKIIEGVMRKNMQDVNATTQSFTGRSAGGGVVWILLATEDPRTINKLLPILPEKP